MKSFFKKIIGNFLGRTEGQAFFRLLHILALRGMNFGGGTLPAESGEEWVINYALEKNTSSNLTVFDVGANKGDYTESWLRLSKQKQVFVHAFEPSKSLANFLIQRFEKKRVKIHNLALGEKEGEMTLFAESEGSGLGSLYERNLEHAGVKLKPQEKIRLSTLSSFCREVGVDSIYFLKLDVEGYEFNILRGSGDLLLQKKIRFVQFEFGGTDIDARVFFKDFYLLLSPNYKIYRILKNGLQEISKYSELDEVFMTTNYLAELKV
ncbi:MAG: FkbM family methyltransferase [Candidatus Doudnabacteria bacterium]|nr:FkbM family methyltransferase [Candidatus Doudnabacteria bacterium]